MRTATAAEEEAAEEEAAEEEAAIAVATAVARSQAATVTSLRWLAAPAPRRHRMRTGRSLWRRRRRRGELGSPDPTAQRL